MRTELWFWADDLRSPLWFWEPTTDDLSLAVTATLRQFREQVFRDYVRETFQPYLESLPPPGFYSAD